MNEKLLVPLDGSQLSQCSLGYVRTIAAGCQAREVIILRVVEPIPSNEIADLTEIKEDLASQLEAKKKADATDYVSGMVKRLKSEGLPARGEIVFGRADEQIIKFAEGNKVDMIIMSTHGRSGISRWAFGSVADKIAHYSRVPVLFISAPECRVSAGF